MQLKKVPLPLCGVMLGFAALGNLLQSYSEGIRLVCGGISAVLGLVLILKIILNPGQLAEDMKNPIQASVSGTFSMALMLLAVYAKPFLGPAAICIWYLGIILHVLLIVYFTVKFMLPPQLPQIFASYYIVYVGIVVASVSAPAFEQTGLGIALFWFGFVSLAVLLVLITVRYIKLPQLPDPARPLFCIYTAPVSLCLAGYLQSAAVKNKMFVTGMAVAAALIYVIVLTQLPKYLRLPFYPSYAAFTFPFVISAIAMKQTMAFMAASGSPLPWMNYFVIFETIVAAVLAAYVLVRYLKAFFD